MVAAVAATATCPGRCWGHPEGVPKGVAPSPPRHFTFEPPPAPRGPSRPRRPRHRRVLYPPAVRRPLPSEEPSAAKRLLVLLLAVVGTQIYNERGDAGDSATTVLGTTLGTRTMMGTPPMPEEPQIPAGITNGTGVVAPMGGSCPSLWVSPPLSPPGGARTR